ncbi:MAG TPA: alpha/beta hydrolase [Xanthobacteraceae bacterium]|nr:alpha/beta hydrolase [Xanthobacteraceae bacterium]
MNRVDSFYFSAPDGLRLHALAADPGDAPRLPVICLPGLARTAEDFRDVIERLAFDPVGSRRVLALDSRGRGRSAHDPDPKNYAVPVELADVLALLAANGIEKAVFVGTSRGGILTMVMASVRPDVIAGAVLNDIGPIVEMTGLLRIKGYVGRLPPPADFADAARLLRGAMGNQFPGWSDATWDRYARLTWEETPRGLVTRYDPALSETLAGVDPEAFPPPLWEAFDALPDVPLMVIRGEHSDLLSRETVQAMRARRPALEVIEVAGEGHAPLLADERTLGPIARLVAQCDG